MKTRAILTSFVLMLAGALTCYAADNFSGTWKLNESKSKIAAGAAKNSTVVYEAAGDQTKVTVDGTSADGKAIHSEWTGKWDGKDYPVTGGENEDTRAYTKVNDHTLSFTSKKGGKVTNNGRIVVSADGKTRTVTTHSTDASGKKMSSTAVYEKQ
ncbi:MAG TPA: hypothetical protein VFA60_02270 [Terriglobales bacterium]|nr:hypothetical protein [Terriglobales bacterium]